MIQYLILGQVISIFVWFVCTRVPGSFYEGKVENLLVMNPLNETQHRNSNRGFFYYQASF